MYSDWLSRSLCWLAAVAIALWLMSFSLFLFCSWHYVSNIRAVYWKVIVFILNNNNKQRKKLKLSQTKHFKLLLLWKNCRLLAGMTARQLFCHMLRKWPVIYLLHIIVYTYVHTYLCIYLYNRRIALQIEGTKACNLLMFAALSPLCCSCLLISASELM